MKRRVFFRTLFGMLSGAAVAPFVAAPLRAIAEPSKPKTDFSVGGWYHFVVVGTEDNKVKVYVNGHEQL